MTSSKVSIVDFCSKLQKGCVLKIELIMIDRNRTSMRFFYFWTHLIIDLILDLQTSTMKVKKPWRALMASKTKTTKVTLALPLAQLRRSEMTSANQVRPRTRNSSRTIQNICRLPLELVLESSRGIAQMPKSKE